MIVSDYVSFRSGMVRDLRTLADVMEDQRQLSP